MCASTAKKYIQALPREHSPGLIGNLVPTVVVGGANIAFLMLRKPSAPYIGVFAYMILPGIMAFGLDPDSVGMGLERRYRRKLSPGQVPVCPEEVEKEIFLQALEQHAWNQT